MAVITAMISTIRTGLISVDRKPYGIKDRTKKYKKLPRAVPVTNPFSEIVVTAANIFNMLVGKNGSTLA